MKARLIAVCRVGWRDEQQLAEVGYRFGGRTQAWQEQAVVIRDEDERAIGPPRHYRASVRRRNSTGSDTRPRTMKLAL